jgi:predicted RNA-binding Zn ribbon-like protein
VLYWLLVKKLDRKLEDLEWVGAHPALDFVNTVHGWTGEEAGEEYLRGYPEVLQWHRMAKLIGPVGTRALSRGGERAKALAHRRIIGLRDSLHRIFRAVAAGRALPQDALDDLNRVIRETVRWRRLTAENGRITCSWDFSDAPPHAILGPVAWQAAELLEHGPLERVKQCPDFEGCGWLFIDTSKNRSRTWCSMKTCGNAAKVRRFRERHA